MWQKLNKTWNKKEETNLIVDSFAYSKSILWRRRKIFAYVMFLIQNLLLYNMMFSINLGSQIYDIQIYVRNIVFITFKSKDQRPENYKDTEQGPNFFKISLNNA